MGRGRGRGGQTGRGRVGVDWTGPASRGGGRGSDRKGSWGRPRWGSGSDRKGAWGRPMGRGRGRVGVGAEGVRPEGVELGSTGRGQPHGLVFYPFWHRVRGYLPRTATNPRLAGSHLHRPTRQTPQSASLRSTDAAALPTKPENLRCIANSLGKPDALPIRRENLPNPFRSDPTHLFREAHTRIVQQGTHDHLRVRAARTLQRCQRRRKTPDASPIRRETPTGPLPLLTLTPSGLTPSGLDPLTPSGLTPSGLDRPLPV